jgi:hypothetical protein
MLIIITGLSEKEKTTLRSELLTSLENAGIFESPRDPHADWLEAVRGAMADASYFISITTPENIRAFYKATMGQAIFIYLRGDNNEKGGWKQIIALKKMGIMINVIDIETPEKILLGVVAIIKKNFFHPTA